MASMKAVVLKEDKSGANYNPIIVTSVPKPIPADDEVLVRVYAVSLNHRDHWIRKGLYPGLVYDGILGADGAGEVVATARAEDKDLIGQRVVINSLWNWESDPEPNPPLMLGMAPLTGTFAEYIAVPRNLVYPIPQHLSLAEAASLPIAAVTAYRALFTKSNVKSGSNVLITGIGGGVALFALQFCVAVGANVYVTSSDNAKIKRAIDEFGAKGGFNYKAANWIDEARSVLGNTLDAIIDGSGSADDYSRFHHLLRAGGIITCYGQTTTRKGVPFNMNYVLKNIDLRGSTMGSNVEFAKMIKFIEEKKIKPVVSHIFSGLTTDTFEDAFRIMQNSSQFGKIVVEFNESNSML
ncbi:uncharacterized protein VTP21DRAFT_2421 [Calcarisporiella thermophila]|uniref:uncharacterized protein n=1 Tax=Calcarisporiella thermophila TaxID=911321 RepID=UPI003742804B